MAKTKCFLVYYRYDDDGISSLHLLNKAYFRQFWDLQILGLSQFLDPRLYYIDYSRMLLKTKYTFCSNISFDYLKLGKFKKYSKLRVGVTSKWPQGYKNNSGFPPFMYPNIKLDKYYEYFAESLNITTRFIPIDSSISRVQQINKFNLVIFLSADMTLGLWNYNKVLIIDYSKLLVIAPITHDTKIVLSDTLLLSLSTVSGLILSAVFTAQYLKFSKIEWSALNIFLLLLGNSVRVNPNNLQTKIIYIILVKSQT